MCAGSTVGFLVPAVVFWCFVVALMILSRLGIFRAGAHQIMSGTAIGLFLNVSHLDPSSLGQTGRNLPEPITANWLHRPGCVVGSTEDLGALFKNLRDATNIVKQRTMIHGRMP
jgi:hypothetical protein